MPDLIRHLGSVRGLRIRVRNDEEDRVRNDEESAED